MWYLTRSTGIVALVLLTAVMVLGVLTSRGWTSERWPRFVSQAMHRNLSLVCLLLIGVHIVTTVADGFAPIGFLDAVVPFHSPYRPLWLGLGALSLDLLLVVGLTTAVRHRIGYRTWRAIHWGAYASWPVAVLHGLGTGTDATLGPVLALTAACVAAVLGAVAWRLAGGWPARAGQRLVGGAAASAFALAAAIFVVVGPLRPGWSRRAGTPASMLASRVTPAPAAAASGTGTGTGGAAPSPVAAEGSGSLPTTPFSATVTGSVTTSQPDASGQVTVEIKGSLTGGTSLPFDIVLSGTPDGGGVAMTSGRVSVGSAQGSVVGLEGDRITADVSAAGTRVRLSFRLSIDQVTGAVQGVVRSGAGFEGSEEGQ